MEILAEIQNGGGGGKQGRLWLNSNYVASTYTVFIPFNFKFSNQSRIDQVQNHNIARFLALVSFWKAICK